MPLSEDEQRILSEIEEQLYESDPDLVREVGSTTVYTAAFRNLKWATLAFVVCTILMVVLLSTHFVWAFIAFAGMGASAFWFERNLRRLGKAGWEQMTKNMRTNNMGEFFTVRSRKMRERFKREEDAD